MKARLHIEAALRNGITYLKNAFYTPPFKVADITDEKRSLLLQLMIMSSSPGVLDGDAYDVKVELGEHTAVRLHTQAYQRLYPMRSGAVQYTDVRLARGSSLYFLPHPVVPHAGSRFTAKTKIFLAEDCTLLWGEVLTCGRKGSGEVFCFSTYHAVTEIFLHNKLVVKENLLLQPSETNINGIGQWEGFTHSGNLFFLHPSLSMSACISLCVDLLHEQKGIEFGVTALPVNGLMLRLLGYKAEQLHRCLQAIADKLFSLSVEAVSSSATNKKMPSYAN